MASPFFLTRPVFSANQLDNTNGIIGYWPFDGDAYDYSGRGLTGSGVNAGGAPGVLPPFTSWLTSQNILMDRSTGVGIPANIVSSNVLSISVWVQLVDIVNYYAIFSIYTSNTDSMEIFYDQGAGKFLGGNFNAGAHTAAAVVSNRLYHLVLTSDGSTTTMFQDGAQSGTTGTTGFSTFSIAGGIGQRPPSGSFVFNGQINDVRVYNRVLSGGEINALYNVGITPPDEGEWPSLLASGVTPPVSTLYSLINVG